MKNKTLDLFIKAIKIKEVSYIYSHKIYCYRCGEWYYEDDRCGC